VRVKCLAQEHNTMSQARARTRTARSGDERTNHEATAPPFFLIKITFISYGEDVIAFCWHAAFPWIMMSRLRHARFISRRKRNALWELVNIRHLWFRGVFRICGALLSFFSCALTNSWTFRSTFLMREFRSCRSKPYQSKVSASITLPELDALI